ncbi:MAG: triple tyrosine motif-containing protein [Thermaerobacter sp.]|nr:triple tyrosine motif-containing protein [Thermaerobacter sp.]
MKHVSAIVAVFLVLQLSTAAWAASPSASPPAPLRLSTLAHQPAVTDSLPPTPAYSAALVKQELNTIKGYTTPRPVSVMMNSPGLQSLFQYAQAASTPGNPLYRHFLTPAQIARRFGPTATQWAKAKAALTEAGWRVTSRQGFIIHAIIPPRQVDPALPVSSAIWSISGITPHRSSPVPQVTGSSGPSTRAAASTSFNLTPSYTASATGANGDVISVMSWNPGFHSGTMPAGLPFTLVVSAATSSGSPLTITNISNISDAARNLLFYLRGPNGTIAAPFPGSSQTLWQVQGAAPQPIASGDTLSLTVSLGDGQSVSLSAPLPAFTGTATVLYPVTGQQVSTMTGSQKVMAHGPGSGPGIAIYTQGQIPSLADLQSLMTQENLPMPSVTFQYFDGASPYMINASDAFESNLDVQTAASVAPGVPITEYVYPANDTTQDPLIAMLTQLAQQSTIKIASFSYGFAGENTSTVAALVAECTAEGITIINASGDQGAWETGNDPGPVGVDTMDNQAGVVSVGGLDMAAPASNPLTAQQSVSGLAIAKAWGGDYLSGLPTAVAQAYTSPNAASTGGFGTAPVPSWQQPFLPSTATGIGVPDISSLAGSPYLLGVFNAQLTGYGGTSLAAPLTAGWLADTEAVIGGQTTGMGNLNPLLYQSAASQPQDFLQAQSGSNGVYSVTSSAPGSWNPVTGLGEPLWDKLAALWNPNTVTRIVLTPSSTQVTAGSPVTVTAEAQNALGGVVTTFSANAAISSSDGNATYPAAVSFQNGTATFTATFATPGSDSLSLTETQTVPALSATVNVSVTSPLTITLNSTAPTVGQYLTVTAAAPLSQATYQFWLYDPATQQWSASGTYSSSNQWSFTPATPGSYILIAYAKSAGASSWAYYTRTTIAVQAASGSPMVSSLRVTAPAITQTSGSSVTFLATANDPGGNPLYQFWVHGPNNRWVQVQNYSSTASYTISNLSPGSYVVAVYALDQRQVSAGQWSKAYYYSTVINVGSSISLNAPDTGTVGQSVAVSASASGLTNPVYQYWIKTPTGLWTQRGFGGATFSFVPTMAGTYEIAVYAKDPYAPATPAFSVMTDQTITVAGS